jgi:hypothetical protein
LLATAIGIDGAFAAETHICPLHRRHAIPVLHGPPLQPAAVDEDRQMMKMREESAGAPRDISHRRYHHIVVEKG